MDIPTLQSFERPPDSREPRTLWHSKFEVGLVCVATAIEVAEWWQYVGAYRVLAEIQLRVLGWYEPFLTGIVGMLMWTCLLMLVATILLRLGVLPDWWSLSPEEAELRRQGQQRALEQHMGILKLGGIGIMGVVIGAVVLAQAYRGRHLEKLEAQQIEQGHLPASSWVAVRGTALNDAMLSMKGRYGKRFFVPVVSDQWTPGQPAAVFIEMPKARRFAPAAGAMQSFDGTVTLAGLPNVIRAEYEQAGLFASDAILIDYQHAPADNTTLGMILCAVGTVAIIIAVVLYVRRARPAPEPAVD